MPPEPPPQSLRLRIDQQALADNWRALDRLSGSARAGAAIKADAYGLGFAGTIPALLDAGCKEFFVAHWSEAAAALGWLAPQALSVLHGPQSPAEASWARATGVRPVINSLRQAALWRDCGGGPCDLMVDTGINRLGLPMSDLGDPLIAALDIDVVMSHLASADEPSTQNEVQRGRWEAARRALKHRRASLANSAGIGLGEAYHGDLTRPGLALYGGVPCAAFAAEVRQVVYPEAQLIQIRNLVAGETVGYNATFTAPAAMRIGIVSLGYADGYLRCWSGKGAMHLGEARLPVLGRVSMDMAAIDLAAAPSAKEGDWVSVDYSLPEAAAQTGLSQYELLTVLGQRFAR